MGSKSMDIEDARIHCQRYIEAGVLRHHARNALYRAGFDDWTVEEVLKEYEQMGEVNRCRQRRFTQSWAAVMFVVCTGVFVYFSLFHDPHRYVLHLWLLAPAALGLMKMLLP